MQTKRNGPKVADDVGLTDRVLALTAAWSTTSNLSSHSFPAEEKEAVLESLKDVTDSEGKINIAGILARLVEGASRCKLRSLLL